MARNPQTTTNGSFFYAGSTSCNAITVTHGGDNFTSGTLWSNGGITASGAAEHGQQGLCWQLQLRLPDPAHAAGWDDHHHAGELAPGVPTTPSTCSTGNVNVNAAWLTANPARGLLHDRQHHHRSRQLHVQRLRVRQRGPGQQRHQRDPDGDTFTGVGTPSTIFYATQGGIAINNPITVNGDLFAPSGLVTFTGGTTTETGFIEASTITLNNGPTRSPAPARYRARPGTSR